MLTGVNTSTAGSLLVFDGIPLEAGLYKITNINNGGFTWLGYTINGTRKEPNGNTTAEVIFQVTESTNVSISGNPNGGTSNQLALYKLSTINPTGFTKAGNGYFNDNGDITISDSDVYSKTLSLDSSKQYALMIKEEVTMTSFGNYICVLCDGTVKKGKESITGNSLVLPIKNTSTLAVSTNEAISFRLSDIVLTELKLGVVNDSYQLTATVTPTDTTDTVVWSVSPSGICAVNNGLVTAVTNGKSVVTATCGSYSATCNVTVN